MPASDDEADTALTFTWECVVEIAGQRQSCTSADGAPIVLPPHPLLTIPPQTLAPLDVAYHFTVAVSKPGRIPQAFTTPVRAWGRFVRPNEWCAVCTCRGITLR